MSFSDAPPTKAAIWARWDVLYAPLTDEAASLRSWYREQNRVEPRWCAVLVTLQVGRYLQPPKALATQVMNGWNLLYLQAQREQEAMGLVRAGMLDACAEALRSVVNAQVGGYPRTAARCMEDAEAAWQAEWRMRGRRGKHGED